MLFSLSISRPAKLLDLKAESRGGPNRLSEPEAVELNLRKEGERQDAVRGGERGEETRCSERRRETRRSERERQDTVRGDKMQ